jgi:hypothetical protein
MGEQRIRERILAVLHERFRGLPESLRGRAQLLNVLHHCLHRARRARLLDVRGQEMPRHIQPSGDHGLQEGQGSAEVIAAQRLLRRLGPTTSWQSSRLRSERNARLPIPGLDVRIQETFGSGVVRLNPLLEEPCSDGRNGRLRDLRENRVHPRGAEERRDPLRVLQELPDLTGTVELHQCVYMHPDERRSLREGRKDGCILPRCEVRSSLLFQERHPTARAASLHPRLDRRRIEEEITHHETNQQHDFHTNRVEQRFHNRHKSN